jgi:LemA protein
LIGRLDERADAAYGDVDALLIERHTLIGNLVALHSDYDSLEVAG